VPELIEVEFYRRAAAQTIGRRIEEIHAPDDWYIKVAEPSIVREILLGRTILGARRRGKLLMIDTDGPVLGLRFGMTGRLLVDGVAPIERLVYSSDRSDPGWWRFGLTLADGGGLAIVDPRRLGGVELDPDEDRLGPDTTTVGLTAFRRVVAGSQAPVKARLMDQSRLAGVGNLICDEVLWRAGIDPARPAGELDDKEVKRLHRALRSTIALMTERGGSHTGDLQGERKRDGRCPKCGTDLDRRTVGGRTTYSCPVHQH
jgi:formamidopyrimidine-DNA glycosylase